MAQGIAAPGGTAWHGRSLTHDPTDGDPSLTLSLPDQEQIEATGLIAPRAQRMQDMPDRLDLEVHAK